MTQQSRTDIPTTGIGVTNLTGRLTLRQVRDLVRRTRDWPEESEVDLDGADGGSTLLACLPENGSPQQGLETGTAEPATEPAGGSNESLRDAIDAAITSWVNHPYLILPGPTDLGRGATVTATWSHARDIPSGVTVTAPLCSSDTRMRWTRHDAGSFVQSYPGSHHEYVTAEHMDARVGAAGYIEVPS